MYGDPEPHDHGAEFVVDGDALEAQLRLTPQQRFEQLVRTVRFIEAGRRALDIDHRA